ncbi:MAG: sugar ABC transporter permease [Chloroflexi bacterium]|nr:sugar ABC transporter permease [Chloroflexota bacterium]
MAAAAKPLSPGEVAAFQQRRRRQFKQLAFGVSLLLPALLFLLPFTIYPAIRVLWSSFFLADLAHPHWQFTGLSNYRYELTNPVFWQVAQNTAVYVLVTVPVSLVSGFLLAIEANKRLRAVGLYRTALFYPSVLPAIGASAIWLYIYLPDFGLADQFFSAFGLPSHNWLGNAGLALPSIMVIAIWKQTGYYTILCLAGLQGLSRDLFEAADIDGASGWQMLRLLTVPLMSPTLVFVSTIAIVNGFQMVDQLFILTNGGPNNATNLLLYFLYQEGFQNFNIGRASTVTILMLAVLMVISLVNYRSLDRSAHYD